MDSNVVWFSPSRNQEKTTIKFLHGVQTVLACSSEMLDLVQRWHLPDIFWENIESKKKSHVTSHNIA